MDILKKIESYVKTSPDKVAIEFRGESLTYSQLDDQSNQLAHYLLRQGIEPQQTVCVLMEPCPDVIISLLAIHKLACIYCPIDPSFPEARRNAILNEASPRLVLVNTHTVDNFYEQAACVNLFHIRDELKQEPLTRPGTPLEIEFESHIFFTSGTTGKPKGVISTHSNLMHYMQSAENAYKFNSTDKFIAAARFTFSISLFELLVPLYCGATIRILPREDVLNLSKLAKHFEWASVFHLGPSLLKAALPYIQNEYSDFSAFDQARHVSTGGDMVPPDVLENLKSIFSNAEVYVIYGSSEISCMGCTYFVPRTHTLQKTLVGKPHQNTSLLILDDHGNAVRQGEVGNVFFSGNGVVKGYLNLPELTTSKFKTRFDERYYDMGDVGRLDSDGNLELLGRKDFQVQIKGIRIELAEIEACLKQLPFIKDAVLMASVLAGQDEKSLVAYLVFNESMTGDYKQLQEHVSTHLPDYMMPRTFVLLEAMPLNHNGKLDRKALPQPAESNIFSSTIEVEAAENKTEEAILQIWRGLFGKEEIGVLHDFFDLGGDSLLAVKFLTEIDQRFKKLVPITAMLNAPTVRAFAKLLESKEAIFGSNDVTVLKAGEAKSPFFCLYGVLLYKELANNLDIDRPVCGVYIEEELELITGGSDKTIAIFSSIENIAQRYVKTIRSFQPHGPYYLGGLSFGGIIAMESARILIDQGEQVNFILMMDSWAPRFQEKISFSKKLSVHFKHLMAQGLPYIKRKIFDRATKQNKLKVSSKLRGSIEEMNRDDDPRDIRGRVRQIATKHYQPKPFPWKTVLVKAAQRGDFEIESEDLGWGPIINDLDIIKVPGDHLSILKSGYVEELACQLKAYLR